MRRSPTSASPASPGRTASSRHVRSLQRVAAVVNSELTREKYSRARKTLDRVDRCLAGE